MPRLPELTMEIAPPTIRKMSITMRASFRLGGYKSRNTARHGAPSAPRSRMDKHIRS